MLHYVAVMGVLLCGLGGGGPLMASVAAQALSAPAASHDTFPYTVAPGDTCVSLSTRFFGERKRYDLLHEDNPSMGPAPHRLVPGTVLNIRVLDRSEADAIVTRRVHRVQARAPGTDAWAEAQRGQELFKGWHVNTYADSQAEVTFRDQSRVHLRENTLIIVYGGSDRTQRRSGGEAFLERGDLRVALGDLRLKVTTASAQARLQGGAAVVSVGEAGASRVSNFEGGAAVVAEPGSKGGVSVRPGFGSVVKKGKRPSRPKKLPAAPRWRSQSELLVVGLRESGGILHGSWTPVEGAAAYRVEVRDGDGSVVAARRADAGTTRFEVHRVPVGDYDVRVSTIDADQLESQPSSSLTVHVAEFGLRKPGQSKPDDRAYDPGDPSVAPVTPQVVAGAELIVPDGVTCQASGRNAEPARITLAAAGRALIVCSRDDTGTPFAPFAINVLTPTVRWAGETPPILVAGTPAEVPVTVTSSSPLPASAHWSVPSDSSTALRAEPTSEGFRLHLAPQPEARGIVPLTLSAEPEGTALATLYATVAAAPAPAPQPASKPSPTACQWHCPPDAGRLEIGLGLSALAVGVDHGLFGDVDPSTRPAIGFAPGASLRLGYYPFRAFGLELEGATLSRPLGAREASGLLWGARAQLVAQLDAWVSPFVLVGGGMLGVRSPSDVLEHDTDAAFHYGAGLKFHVLRSFGFRIDLRHVMSEGRDDSLSHHLDMGLSVTGVLPL